VELRTFIIPEPAPPPPQPVSYLKLTNLEAEATLWVNYVVSTVHCGRSGTSRSGSPPYLMSTSDSCISNWWFEIDTTCGGQCARSPPAYPSLGCHHSLMLVQFNRVDSEQCNGSHPDISARDGQRKERDGSST
jgi:hypothetical protein